MGDGPPTPFHLG